MGSRVVRVCVSWPVVAVGGRNAHFRRVQWHLEHGEAACNKRLPHINNLCTVGRAPRALPAVGHRDVVPGSVGAARGEDQRGGSCLRGRDAAQNSDEGHLRESLASAVHVVTMLLAPVASAQRPHSAARWRQTYLVEGRKVGCHAVALGGNGISIRAVVARDAGDAGGGACSRAVVCHLDLASSVALSHT